MEENQSELVQTLQTTLRSLKSQEDRLKQQVLQYEKRINNELQTTKQYIVNKPQLQQQKQKTESINKKKEEMDQKLEMMIGQFNTHLKQTTQSKKSNSVVNNLKEKQKGVKEVPPPKGIKKEEPKKIAQISHIIQPIKPKIEAFYLSNFNKPVEQITFKQKKGQRINIKDWVKQYKDQELKNAQSQRKARLGFINTLSKYAPQRNQIIRQYTDKHPKRGWKGCEYSTLFYKYLQSINKQQLIACLNPKSKIADLFKWNQVAKKLMMNWEILENVRESIKGPKRLNLKLQFNPLSLQSHQTQKNSKQSLLDIDVCLDSFYLSTQKILANFLQKESLKRNDLKLLVQICNVVLTKGKKCFTVIKYDELDYMLNVIENGPERE